MDQDPEDLRALPENEKRRLCSQFTGQERKKMKALLYGKKPLLSKEAAELTEIFKANTDAATRTEKIFAESSKLFEEMDDPFAGFLDLYKRMVDVHVASSATMAGETLKSFSLWLDENENKDELFHRYCTPAFQNQVIMAMTAFHTAHIDLAERVFRLNKEDIIKMIRDRIKKFIHHGKYKEAMALSEQFDMNRTWTFEAYLLPRLLQDQNGYQAVKEHSKGFPKLEKALIQFMDELVFSNKKKIREVGERFEQHININHSLEFLTMHSAKRKVKDLLEYYKLESEMDTLAPQYAWKIREAEITYALRQRYQDKTLSHDSYVSKIKKYLENTNITRKEYLVKLIWTKKEIYEENRQRDAIYWSLLYKLEPWRLPQDMQNFMADNKYLVEEIREQVFAVKNTKTLDNLWINDKRIIFVEDLDSLASLTEKLLKEPIIGFDSETVPELILQSKLALLQISISDGIYLVDFYKFITEKMLTDEVKDTFLSAFLLSDGLKLGFDIANDLRLLPIQNKVQQKNCLCLKRFIETIIDTDPCFIDLSEGDGKASIKLSTICERLLGVDLDKTQQQSNWAFRPLEEAQMHYAALDADILLKLFDKIKEISLKKGLDFEELIQKSMGDVTKPAKNKEIKEKMDSMRWCEYVCLFGNSSSSRKPTEMSIGLDLMLLGLAKPIRRCGIDVLAPKEHINLVRQAKRNREMVLFTSGKAFERLNNDFPGGRVVYIDADDNALLQMATIMKKLSVHLDPKDVFTRCKECNHLGFIVLPTPVVQVLHHKTVVCSQLYFTGTFDAPKWRKHVEDVDPVEYDGYGCKLDPNEDYFHVNVYGGRIDIIRNLYIYQEADEWKTSLINNVPDDCLNSPGRVFYLCANCGKFYYE